MGVCISASIGVFFWGVFFFLNTQPDADYRSWKANNKTTFCFFPSPFIVFFSINKQRETSLSSNYFFFGW